ncbi:hypothetical protein B0G76_2657 [Paraburkholderia sp. BL23I1N1]|nr:hypothetical protein B0G76_2657 [Paraburkholderia sp. BL23I1N1]
MKIKTLLVALCATAIPYDLIAKKYFTFDIYGG